METYNRNKLSSSFLIEDAEDFSYKLRKSNYKFMFNSFLRQLIGNDIWIERSILNDVRMFAYWDKKDIDIFRFLFCGHTIDKDVLDEKLGVKSTKFLLSINFAKLKEGILYTNGYSIVPILDMFILISTPYEYNNNVTKFVDIYIGQDSFSMMNMISSKNFENILDLCAGSGIQGFNAIKNNESFLTSIEINENAYNSIKINAAINGFYKNTFVKLADLYDGLEEKKFDCILSNPPYVPAPQNINVPICGDGGENGFEIVDRIIKGYDKYLSKGGYAYMVLECIGSDTQPYIIDVFNKYRTKGTLNIRVITAIPVEMQIDYSINLISYLSDEEDRVSVRKEFERIFRENNATKMYSVVIEYINNDVPLTINRIDTDNISLNKKYKFNESVKFDKTKLAYTKIMVDNEPFLDINEKIFDNIKKNDSIRKILTDLKPDEYNEYMMIFSILNGNNILTFEGE